MSRQRRPSSLALRRLGGRQGRQRHDVIDCEDALTNYHPDGKPVMEETIINLPSNLTVDPTPIFNTATGECYGGKPKTTKDEYKNVATGKCLQGGASGSQLTTATCNGSASQQLSSTAPSWNRARPQQSTTLSSGKVVLRKCDGGPARQWSINPNKTISDMQHNTRCYRDASGKVTAASCSGDAAKWTFKAAPAK